MATEVGGDVRPKSARTQVDASSTNVGREFDIDVSYTWSKSSQSGRNRPADRPTENPTDRPTNRPPDRPPVIARPLHASGGGGLREQDDVAGAAGEEVPLRLQHVRARRLARVEEGHDDDPLALRLRAM